MLNDERKTRGRFLQTNCKIEGQVVVVVYSQIILSETLLNDYKDACYNNEFKETQLLHGWDHFSFYGAND